MCVFAGWNSILRIVVVVAVVTAEPKESFLGTGGTVRRMAHHFHSIGMRDRIVLYSVSRILRVLFYTYDRSRSFIRSFTIQLKRAVQVFQKPRIGLNAVLRV